MPAFIIGAKSTQSQRFNDKGERIPTTFIKTNSCWLTDVKTPSRDGYFSVKLGFGQIKNIKRPRMGELEKAGIKTPLRFLREFRMDLPAGRQVSMGDKVILLDENNKLGVQIGEIKILVGQEIKPTIFFKKGDKVMVSGTSKGKGFQGVVKRHHFKGGSRTHGQSHGERAPGSIGMTTTPGRVFKGKRMAGRMGNDRVTVKGLEVVEVKEDGIVVSGLVPGFKGGLVEVRS
ncbi:MAG: 50S ribosomal protein L3 [Candidatus Roizmanbacteria bacterium GW2011_GWC2_37_13]|uniref:Large ribosomal subunit protein uL3 n=1 Tax=Candidatus Roizmanbacteria bacterium GW2011_GWC2_37_13 TaxID=1618486 RepID=A0A0G0G6C7_9BACT|nr:MAG: 50S ribosomal protein L3, large subunit ribosomal protein L3 [Candidatus Roizmanbacteria bacterium GW2011_GWC1_37_12]KKQ26643.1 MAG: 50S ribosomal protein L3 [Candidatus Roizmanbacteria bacterium GW2011_GWC2_37_13]